MGVTDVEKILAKCELRIHELNFNLEPDNLKEWLIKFEGERLEIIRALLEDRERLIEALDEVTRCVCNEGYKIRDMRDPNCNCLYRDTLAQSEQTTKEILG